MKITIDLNEEEVKQLGWSWPPVEFTPQTDNKTNNWLWQRNTQNNGAWVDGIDRCAKCPNNPNNPNSPNYGQPCFCAIPSMFGPNRIIC